MDIQNEALLKLFASGAVGAAYQWFLFGPKKIPNWQAWGALGGTTLAAYIWANHTAIASFSADWRFGLVSIVSFFLTAKGSGSTLAAFKLAPKSNSI